MAEAIGQFKRLEDLMGEEIRQYNLLMAEIKEEAKYLQQDAAEPLQRSIAKIEKQREILLGLHEALRKEFYILTNSSELKEETLAALLPRQIYQKWQRHQQEVTRLKKRVRNLNLQNKAFLQEVLDYWQEIRRLIANSPNNLSYRGVQDNNRKVSPFLLNQRV